jgi:Cu/Ag efflux protein CusF
MFRSLRTVVTSLAVASVIGSAAQAYASTSTQAVAAQAQISTAGVAIKAVDYKSSGATLQAVTFRVDNPSASVSIRLRDDSQWIRCANSAVERLEVSAA